ncbi:MAG: hypothetical protein H0V63_09910, partial [Burkholderiaceae bacterium]|nr:hypothetical protein [Burkholderiaceae bacterium]
MLVLFAGCEGTQKISNRNLAYLYTPALNFMYPDYRVCSINPDTSRVFFSISSEELLFMKSGDSNSFYASIAVNFRVLFNYESKIPIDSGTLYFDIPQDSLPDNLFSATIDVYAPDSSDYLIQLEMTDINRQQAVGAFYKIDRTGLQPSENFMVLDAETGKPFLKNYTNTQASIRLLNTNSNRAQIYMRFFNAGFPLSKPPFSNDDNKALSYKSDQTFLIDLDKSDIISLDKP